MKLKVKKHIGMCGLVCSACAAFIATKNNDDKLRSKTAKEWTERYTKDRPDRPPVKAEDINCTGCLSEGPIYFHCSKCLIRKCGIARKIKNCSQCKSYKCNLLKQLQKQFF